MQVNLQLIDGHYRNSYYDEGRLALRETSLSYIRFFLVATIPSFTQSLPGRVSTLWHSLSSEQSDTAAVLAVLVAIALVTKIA